MVDEVSVKLIDGTTVLYEWHCTPDNLEALAVGRLYADGVISTAGVAKALTVERSPDEILLRLAEPLRAERTVRVRLPQVAIPSGEQFAALFRELFARIDERHKEGGMHGAALVRSGSISFQADDVGRHNAVDKVIGLALLSDADLAVHGMLVSSRVSGEIARKAAHSAVAWLASRSIPTTRAVQIAKFSGMPIVGRAAGKNAFVYR